MIGLLTDHAGVTVTSAPDWYQLPDGYYGSDYLLRLEQLLAVACSNLEGGGLHGERNILDETLKSCVNQPNNPTILILFVNMLCQMKKVRPEILFEYKEKVNHLQRDYHIKGIGPLVDEAVSEAFTS